MKKLLCVILTVAMTAALLSGCSLFATQNNADDGEQGESSGSTGPIQITDSYTYEDPADLDFDERYVIYCGEASEAVSFMADTGMKGIYIVLYGKEGKTLRHHTIEVYDTAENAQAAVDTYTEYDYGAVIVEEDPTVLYYLQEGDELEASILSYVATGSLKDESFESYVDCMHESWGGELQ